jgi:hypothetical protein
MQRFMRRMKDSLVSTALKVQMAHKLHAEDMQTIEELRKDAERSRRREKEASIAAEQAADIIGELRMEISQLKRQAKKMPMSGGAGGGSSVKSRTSKHRTRDEDEDDLSVHSLDSSVNAAISGFKPPPPLEQLDAEVDAMFADLRKQDG